MKASVLETIKKSATVPSMPQVVVRFLEIMQDPNFEYRDLARLLSSDPGTVSEVLRLANSALFGIRNKVVSLQHALTLLGPKRTRSLLLGRYLVDAMSRKKVVGLDMNYYWRRSLAASVIASRFADAVTPRVREEAFIAAVLADIGIPILTETFVQPYAPLAARFAPNAVSPTPDEEIDAVEASHAQVSAMVLTHWRLPEEVSVAVNLHQSPHPGDTAAADIARLLNAADRIAKLLCEVPQPDEIAAVCIDATNFVGTDIGVLMKLLPTIESDIEDLADALRIDVLPTNVYALVAKTIQERLSVSVD